MKKIILGVSVVALTVFGLVLYSTSTRADDNAGGGNNNNNNHNNSDRPNNQGHEDNNHNGRNFNSNKELSKSACGDNLGKPVINVTQKVQNDVDSGFVENWAFDYYTRHITVWATGVANAYCAIVTYDGQFYAVPGQNGPGNNPAGALIDTPTNAPVNGDMTGGYKATFNGTLTAGSWPTSGSVGTTNYQCDLSANCPGRVSWVLQYFPDNSGFAQPWWGWKYDGGSHGTWINAIDVSPADSGNIL